jgi:hypothetical protein
MDPTAAAPVGLVCDTRFAATNSLFYLLPGQNWTIRSTEPINIVIGAQLLYSPVMFTLVGGATGAASPS